MPLGTGQDQEQNIPVVAFTPSPAQFDAGTSKTEQHNIVIPTPGPGQPAVRELAKSGVLVWIRLTFEGTLVTTTPSGTVTTRWGWPYAILDNVAFTANLQSGLVNASGVDLHVHRFLRNPSFVDATDNFTGTIGGGNVVAAGTYHLSLTWDVPVITDWATLGGAIFAQSNQNSLAVTLTQAAQASLFDLTGAATATLAGNWTVQPTTYEIPTSPEQGIITPDLSRLHAIQARETSFSSAGDVAVPLTQVNGQLLRLLVQVRGTANSWLSPRRTSATPVLDSYKLIYGANQVPLDYKAQTLMAINNEHYGAPLPYGYVCFDFLRTGPIRDAVYMPGLTDLKVVPVVTSAATLDANAKVRVVQEVLFQ